MTAAITPVRDAIVLCHLGVPRIDEAKWTLTVDGLVARPIQLSFADLRRFPQQTLISFHQCAGSPLAPTEPTRRICNLQWGGARLADILHECGVDNAARFIWSSGLDYGEFGGVAMDNYQKDLPIERLHDDVLIAYEINGEKLPAENGFPARLVVPGFYGTNSVKWLTRLTLADRRANGAFTTRWYNDPVLDAAGRDTGASRPVWAVAPESVIVAPVPGAALHVGKDYRVWGWAWSDAGIAAVDVSTDGGREWTQSLVEPRIERGWQRFSWSWRPMREGAAQLQSRARNADGTTQPVSGARNAIHTVEVKVV
jgi:DMSO/TMAO reductase YedYZ molybdopterin-dependent catalytic subunit